MRLSTRLSLSYIGFLLLLGVLVLVLAGLQLSRLARAAGELPTPASPYFAELLAEHLAENGLATPLPADYLRDTLGAGGWTQVLDVSGREVQAVAVPEGTQRIYTAPELVEMANPWPRQRRIWFYEIARIPGNVGVVIMAVPSSQVVTVFGGRFTRAILNEFSRHFLTGVGMAVVAAIALALLAGLLYARRIARPLVSLSAELKTAAAGDFSHRIPVSGKDEFAVLATAYNSLVERLGEAQRERDRTEEARRDLVANISHDLRTPLTSIQGFTEAMADLETTPENRHRYASLVADRVRALDALLGDLLELSRLQALPGLKRAPVDLPELVREQIIALMPHMEQAGVEVDADLPDSFPPVYADARLLGRAVTNLLVNALRHSTGAARLGVSLWPSADGAAITVRDDGCGIPADEVPHLFERYYQGTSATQRRQGAGLGLAIVKQIADAHGGRISVETAEGRGTAFTLWLPMSG